MAYLGDKKILNITSKGDSAFIRYSAYPDGSDFTKTWSPNQIYIGFATGQIAPTDKSEYTWAFLTGEQGEPGNDGITPHIGDNGNWWVGDADTGVKAQGERGFPGVGEAVLSNVTNIVGNGNFNGTGTWASTTATIVASDNTLTMTGNGAQAYARVTNITRISGSKNQPFAVHFKVRVTNSDCQQIKLMLFGGYAAIKINSPVADKWYDITCDVTPSGTFTNQNCMWFDFAYADVETANGKTQEIQEVMLFDTSVDFGLGVNPPICQIEDMIKTNGYWEGTQEVILPKAEVTLNNAEDGYTLPNPVAFHSRTRQPVVTFVCDDCHEADFEKLCSVSEKYGVAFTSARFALSGLKNGLALYLQDTMGWEFASHTYSHTPLATLETEAEIENELKQAREYMASIGLKCDTLIYPEGSNDERVRRIAKKYFKCAATTNTGDTLKGINTGVIPSFYLKRYPLGSFNSNDVIETHKARVDEAIANNGWLIFMLHPANSAHTDEKTAMLCELIEYIQSKGVEIKTLRDGYEDFKNAIEIGDYIGGDEGCAISATGERKNI